jgi:hypothetical protein
MRGGKMIEIVQHDSCETRNSGAQHLSKAAQHLHRTYWLQCVTMCVKHTGYVTSRESHVVCRRKLRDGHFEGLFLELYGIAKEK